MTTQAPAIRSSRVAPALVFGFGTAAAMWCVGFLTHLPGIDAPAPLVGVLMLLTMLTGAAACGRAVRGHTPISTGALSGLACGVINVLILGALLTEDDGSANPDAAIFLAGWLGLSAIVGAIGGLAGSKTARDVAPARAARDWAPAFAIVCVVAAVPVLFSGGLVTSHNAGLAVPDWPTSFNANMFMYPLSKMTGGIYYEHAHRLFGSLVGLTVLVFMLSSYLWKAPKRTKVCASVAFALVLTQGIIGGIRVTQAADADDAREQAAMQKTVDMVNPDLVTSDYALTYDNTISLIGAIYHGVFGQLTLAFLCITCALATIRFAKGNADIERRPDTIVRYGSMLLIATLILQLLMGAISRHKELEWMAWTHGAFAFVVVAILSVVAMRATKYAGTPLPKLGVIASGIVIVQVVLGFAALALVLPTYDSAATGPDPAPTALTATFHQATGAALLGTCALLNVWGMRCTTRSAAPIATEQPALA
ncbi:MAG: COX15/CtaA family protein [Planctomycetota bacterium]